MTIAGRLLPHESSRGHVTGDALYTDDLVGLGDDLPAGLGHVGSQARRGEEGVVQDDHALDDVLEFADVAGIGMPDELLHDLWLDREAVTIESTTNVSASPRQSRCIRSTDSPCSRSSRTIMVSVAGSEYAGGGVRSSVGVKRSNTGIATVTNLPERRRPRGTPGSVRAESPVRSMISSWICASFAA